MNTTTFAPTIARPPEPPADDEPRVTCAGPERCLHCELQDPALVDDCARRHRCLILDYPF
jgi:hypothetical protein